jgi:ATP-dependent Clp protease ATP-binding subunit ClpC
MSTIHLDFPCHVRTAVVGGAKSFIVRPLFAGGPAGVAQRFDRALQKCVRAVRDEFKFTRLTRADLEELLWYRFSPELEFRIFRLQVKTSQGFLEGPFSAAWFDRDGRRYVVLPGFECHFFAPPAPADGRWAMESLLAEAVQHLLREEKRTLAGQAPHPRVHFADEREFVTAGATTVELKDPPFPFESGERDLFASLFRDQATFDGAEEIERVGRDLNAMHPEELMRAWGEEEAVARLGRILFQERPAPVAIIGPRGVGKSAIVHEAVARQIEADPSVHPDRLQKVWTLDPSRVIAGMRIVGMWQNRLEAILAFARTRLMTRYKIDRPDAIFVDNVVALHRVGRSSQSDLTLADVLKSCLERREVGFVVEATPEQWTLAQELDRPFCDLFQVVRVAEPDRERAIRTIVRHRAELEKRHGCTIHDDALGRVLELQRAFPQRTSLPGSVVEVLKELANRHRTGAVGTGEVEKAFRGATRLNATLVDPAARLDDRELREFIERRLVGQEEARRCLAETIHAVKARVGAPERPSGSFLFIGPTGVGKTEAAKVLSQFLFPDDDEALIRFDMNEFIDDGAVGRLIGDFARPEGQLTGRVRHRPFCVLLFDEIEKAHESVHDLLLQVLGEGRLTDSLGRTVDFGNAVVVMTSNLGAGEASRSVGFVRSAADQAAAYRKAVEEFFRPEFVNRIDRIVSFGPLAFAEVRRIARLQIEKLLRRDGFIRRTTSLNVREAALDAIARRGFDAEMGGRALKRAVERELAYLAASRLVRLPAAEPVILDVHLRDGRLEPRVIGLPFLSERAEPVLFEPPADDDIRPFVERLHAEAGRIESAIAASRPAERGAMDPEYLLFKDRAYQLRKELLDVLADIPERAPAAAFSFKFKNWKSFSIAHGEKIEIGDLFAQLDIREYLAERFRATRREVAGARAMAMEKAVQVAALDVQARAFTAGRRETTCIHVRSCVEGSGVFNVIQLQLRYHELAQTIDPQFGSFDQPFKGEEAWLFTSSPGLSTFLAGETGVHLFLEPYGASVPVQVRVLTVPHGTSPADFVVGERERREAWLAAFDRGELGDSADPWRPGRIVRIYAMPGGGQDGTVTDLRTGLMDRFEATGLPWFVWAYSAFMAGAP